MALLARACLDNETLAEMASTRTITLEGRTFTNHNKLLWRYEGCVGMKTGYTEKAGRTLVSAAEREGMTLIAVTLNDPDDWADHAALLGLRLLPCTLASRGPGGETVGSLPVSGSLLPLVPIQAGEDAVLAPAGGGDAGDGAGADPDRPHRPGGGGGAGWAPCGAMSDGALVGEVPLVCARLCPGTRQSRRIPSSGCWAGSWTETAQREEKEAVPWRSGCKN